MKPPVLFPGVTEYSSLHASLHLLQNFIIAPRKFYCTCLFKHLFLSLDYKDRNSRISVTLVPSILLNK